MKESQKREGQETLKEEETPETIREIAYRGVVTGQRLEELHQAAIRVFVTKRPIRYQKKKPS